MQRQEQSRLADKEEEEGKHKLVFSCSCILLLKSDLNSSLLAQRILCN
jgi:hypothetical protein